MEKQPIGLVEKVEEKRLKRKEKIYEINKMINSLTISDQRDNLDMCLNKFHEKLHKMMDELQTDSIKVKID
jgi:hypothetical protein